MPASKSTKLNVRDDRPTALASSTHGSNIYAVGFNIMFIAAHNPKLATVIVKSYAEAHKIRQNDPVAPDEDFALFVEEVTKLFKENQEND